MRAQCDRPNDDFCQVDVVHGFADVVDDIHLAPAMQQVYTQLLG